MGVNLHARGSASLVTGFASCVAAVTLAACAAVSAPSANDTNGVTATSPSPGTPQQRAAAEAGLMLKDFAPPPGARQVSASPAPSSTISKGPQAVRPADDDVVTATAWWLAPGDPQGLLNWEVAHIPPLYVLFSQGTVGKGSWSDNYQLKPVAGLFDDRALAVSTTSAGHGQTAIRVDALVDWIPARASGDTIPVTTAVVTAVLTRNVGDMSRAKQVPVSTATITDPGQVRAIVAYLNDLPVQPPGVTYNCPPFEGGTLTLTFRARADGPPLATAYGIVSGCQMLQLTVTGRQPISWPLGAAGNWFNQVMRVTGLGWKVPPPPSP
jgi:hypothetical protein